MSELLSGINKNTSLGQSLKARFSHSAFLLGLSFGIFVASAGLLYKQHQEQFLHLQSAHAPLSQLEETLQYIENEYVDNIDKERLHRAALHAVMQELDTHSSYLDQDSYQELVADTDGAYSGIGIDIETIDNRVFIISPIDGSPAAKVGLRAGDEIIKVDGQDIAYTEYKELLGKVRGRVGTSLALTIRRSNKPLRLTKDVKSSVDKIEVAESELLEVNLVRAVIPVHSVKSAHLANGIAYLRLSHFTERSADDLNKAINNWQAKTNPKVGIIIDLRNNPGGLVNAAVDVADLFLNDGVIVSAEGRSSEANFKHLATEGDITNGLPLVVLINHATASSAEIVAAALKEKSRAIIVGFQSFGKGSVQSVIPMKKGDALKLTTSYYYTPNGLSLHGRGVRPDIAIDESGMSINVKELHALNEKDNHQDEEKSLYKLLTTLAIKDPTLLRAWQHLDDQHASDRSQIAMDNTGQEDKGSK